MKLGTDPTALRTGTITPVGGESIRTTRTTRTPRSRSLPTPTKRLPNIR